MPSRHFYLLRHHILFYIKFLLFCSLAPDEIRFLCGENKGGCPEIYDFYLGKIPRRNASILQTLIFWKVISFWYIPRCPTVDLEQPEKRKSDISQMRLGSIVKMQMSILTTATTEQMGYITFSFFVYYQIYKSVINILGLILHTYLCTVLHSFPRIHLYSYHESPYHPSIFYSRNKESQLY